MPPEATRILTTGQPLASLAHPLALPAPSSALILPFLMTAEKWSFNVF